LLDAWLLYRFFLPGAVGIRSPDWARHIQS
jgi:hypothetical protein